MRIRVEIDDRLRLISSLLTLAGFDWGDPAWRRHPLRVLTDKLLGPHECHVCASVTRELAREHFMSVFYGYGVLLAGLNEGLARREEAPSRDWEEHFAPLDAVGYPELLMRFHEDTGLGAFWERTDDLWQQECAACRGLLDNGGVEEFLDLLFGPSLCALALVPAPLDPFNWGFGVSSASTAYAICGPPLEFVFGPEGRPSTQLEPVFGNYGKRLWGFASHELAHTLLCAALEPHTAVIDELAPLGDLMELRGWFPDMYEGWPKRFEEVLLRAAGALYWREREGEARAHEELRREKTEFGIDLVDDVYECLSSYLDGRRTGGYAGLSEYIPELAARLLPRNPSSEEQRCERN